MAAEEPASGDIRFVNMTPGWHVTTGPRVILYHPAARAEGDFRATATMHLFAPGQRNEAYGLFVEGEADMVLSYTTSPAYHLIAEEDDTKTAARFDEGHYLQVEVAGKLAHTEHPDLADEFLEFMVTDAFQSV